MSVSVPPIKNRAEALEQDEIVQNLMKVLEEAGRTLPADQGRLYGWSLSIVLNRSDQRLMPAAEDNSLSAGTLREDIREKTVTLKLYLRHGEPETMGTASLSIDPLRSLADQVAEGLAAARTNFNSPWELPAPADEPFATVRTVDETLLDDPVGVTERLARQASEACRALAGVKVNYAELFVNTSLKLTLTSTGLRLPRTTSDLYFEVAMEKLPLPNTQEVHNYRKSLDAAGLDLPGFLRETATETLALDEVEMPATDENATLLLHAPEINRILHGLLDQCEAGREYNHLPHLSVDEIVPVDVGSGESSPNAGTDSEFPALTIHLDPSLDLMAETTAFTGEGLPARGGVILENGVVRAQKISQRMGAYLEREPNALCGNIVIAPGTHTSDELRQTGDQVIEILSFSSLLVNPDQLTWSSEIKLGRLYERTATGWKQRLLKGGIVSGNIRENLQGGFWSKEIARHNSTADIFSGPEGYQGPATWLIQNGATISGSD